ncbi:hypothetical protein GCM10022280_18170 [Sphingomonas swuensis]|uniref:Uncharacterized protein n=1 Tax=Sphingomonas swuensis TaxID=977800 RepID=A0ABP7SZT3_9SPHN
MLDLLARLDQAGVGYVHWKSNVRLADALCGVEDLDLLVRPQDSDALIGIVNRCGFKLGVSRWGAGHPGVFHALAWDSQLGRIIDLHAYHQLVSGDSFAKSYRFPLERKLLEDATTMLGCRVPEPSAELVLFLLRILLKHTAPVELHKVSKSFDQTVDELSWLLGRVDLERAEELRRDYFPDLPFTVQQLAADVLRPMPVRVLTGLRLAWALRRHRRLRPHAVLLSRWARVVAHYAARARGRRTLSLQSGGAWVAFAGPKGTGKSTLANMLGKGLATKLDVEVVHLGKPPPGVLSACLNLFKPALQRALPSERLCEYERPERRSERRYSLLFVARKLLLALDRRRLLGRCTRAMASGTIIISDRCPTTGSSGLDGSAFDDLAVQSTRSRVKRWMMERERSIYRALPHPTVVLKLEAPLEVAILRDRFRSKAGGPDAKAIERRWKLESEAEFAFSAVIPISTAGTIDETFRTVGEQVWRSI